MAATGPRSFPGLDLKDAYLGFRFPIFVGRDASGQRRMACRTKVPFTSQQSFCCNGGAVLHKSVFVVDDDDSLRRSLERLLRSEGYDVETFRSAEDFLVSDFPNPCCLVLDVYLPGIDGVELQHQLAGTARELPVVAISARSEEATRQRALDAGAAAFLVKPFKPSALLDAIERATARTTMPKGDADDNHGADSLD